MKQLPLDLFRQPPEPEPFTPALPTLTPERDAALRLSERADVARSVWGEIPMHELLRRCMEVEDVASGRGTPCLSRVEVERVREAILALSPHNT